MKKVLNKVNLIEFVYILNQEKSFFHFIFEPRGNMYCVLIIVIGSLVNV